MNSTRIARLIVQPLVQDHDGAAQAHEFPGEQEKAAMLKAEHAEGTQQAASRAE